MTGRINVHGRSHEFRAAGTRHTDADNYERGPVRMREAIQYSLNIPGGESSLDQRRRPTS